MIDLKVDGTGGFPRLLGGGVGYRNVTIGLTSQRGHGLHFNITIFGKWKTENYFNNYVVQETEINK